MAMGKGVVELKLQSERRHVPQADGWWRRGAAVIMALHLLSCPSISRCVCVCDLKKCLVIGQGRKFAC